MRWLRSTPTLIRLVTVAAIVAMVAMAATVTGCSRETRSTPVPAPVLDDPVRVGGQLKAIDGPSGLRPDAPKPLLQASGTDGGELDEFVRQVITDTEDFWDTAYQQTFTGTFQQVQELISWDANKRGGNLDFCGTKTDGMINAAYCPGEHTMGWDRGILLPAFRKAYGDMGVAMVLAHEYGHAVSRLARLTNRRAPILIGEQQADCLAGVYSRWVTEGKSPRFQLSSGDGLNGVLAAIAMVGDQPLTEDEWPQNEHGSVFERISAFQFGFTEGPPSCAAINAESMKERREGLPGELQMGENGELPVTEESVQMIIDELNNRFTPDQKPQLRFGTDASCADAQPSPPASYCPHTNTITVDLPALIEIGAVPSRDGMTPEQRLGSALSLTGDNTAYSALESRYLMALQHQRGLKLDTVQTGLRTACMTGATTAMLATPFKTAGGTDVRLSAGDLDEAVIGLLTNGIAASDVNGNPVPAGFARVEAFRIGVLGGDVDQCANRYS